MCIDADIVCQYETLRVNKVNNEVYGRNGLDVAEIQALLMVNFHPIDNGHCLKHLHLPLLCLLLHFVTFQCLVVMLICNKKIKITTCLSTMNSTLGPVLQPRGVVIFVNFMKIWEEQNINCILVEKEMYF